MTRSRLADHDGARDTPARGDPARFEEERSRLTGLAYRILGSRAEAEDVVQDAWLRWQRAGPDGIERPSAWLTTVVSRLALDRLGSAQRRRETYVGPWLPEPVIDDPTRGPSGDPAELVELQESLTLGFLLVLERLGPVERVVFLLADVFGVPFDEIADTVDRSPAACRQIASRARRRVQADRPRYAPTDDEAWAATAAFFAAAQAGDLDALVAVLADDVVLVSDGGADHHAARRPVLGPHRVSRLLANLTGRLPDDAAIDVALVNGQPGALVRSGGTVWAALAAHVLDGRIARLYLVVNPDKLGDGVGTADG